MINGCIYKIALLGGDIRMIAAASRLTEVGFLPSIYGIDINRGRQMADIHEMGTVDSGCCSYAGGRDISDYGAFGYQTENLNFAETPWEAIEGSCGVILPLPVSSDGEHLSTPFAPYCHLKLQAIGEKLKAYGVKLVCGGKFPDSFAEFCRDNSIEVFDYYEREEFAVANAVPTAEGAIEIALRELPVTVNGAEMLVIGYGRIGKVLAKLLASLGANVTVSARKEADFAWISANGFKSAATGELSKLLEKKHFDTVFNTVPRVVLGEEELLHIKRDTLIVDLASKPGGIDVEAAKSRSLNTVWALSLPGKCAPLTAGKIIADTVSRYIIKKGGS